MESNQAIRKALFDKLQDQMIAEIQDYAIILLDIDGMMMSWNKGVECITGYTSSEIIGNHFRLFYLPSDVRAGLPEKLIHLAKKEGRARHIGRRIKKDGKHFWGSILITALHDEDGQVIGFTKVTKEIIDQERME